MAARRAAWMADYSTSYLDLCCCALGGLILLMVLLVPLAAKGPGLGTDEDAAPWISLQLALPVIGPPVNQTSSRIQAAKDRDAPGPRPLMTAQSAQAAVR